MPTIDSVIINGARKQFVSVDGHTPAAPPAENPIKTVQYKFRAAGDTPPKFSGSAKQGDWVVLLWCGQQPDETFTSWTSSGFTATPVAGLSGNRMGYCFAKKVGGEKYLSTISWWNPNLNYGGRQMAVVIVVDGKSEVSLSNWTQNPPAPEGNDFKTYFVGQSHYTGAVQPAEWGDEVLFAGNETVSTDASWTSMRIATGTPATGPSAPQAWAALNVKAPAGTAAPPKIEIQQGTKAGVMPFGYQSTALAFNKNNPQVRIAHRGISDSLGEHTDNAYTDAVARAFPVLEMSLGRSSDGVWFGCHDATLERLDGPPTKVSEMTWHQIEAAMFPLSKRPMTLLELLKAYGNSHVLLLDPKYEAARMDELHAITGPYKERIAWKYFGDATWFFNKMKSLGYMTYAYSYIANADKPWFQTMLDNANIDVLAMDFDASSEIWNRLKATNKFLVGHITHTEQDANTARSNGAHGVMIADGYRFNSEV